MSAAGVGLLVQRLDAHLLHQSGDVLAADLVALPLEHVTQHAAAGKWMPHVQFLDPPHQCQVRFTGLLRPVIRSRTCQ
jgi:hypothetical protein